LSPAANLAFIRSRSLALASPLGDTAASGLPPSEVGVTAASDILSADISGSAGIGSAAGDESTGRRSGRAGCAEGTGVEGGFGVVEEEAVGVSPILGRSTVAGPEYSGKALTNLGFVRLDACE